MSALAASRATSLRAVTVRVDSSQLARGSVDPLALAGDDGSLFWAPDRIIVGRGTASSYELPGGMADPAALRGATRWLEAVHHETDPADPGPPLVAIAALPFEPGAPGTMLLPEITYRRAGGAEWVTLAGVGDDRADAAACLELVEGLAGRERAARPAPAPRHLSARPEPSEYEARVAEAVRAIKARRLRKVVLARSLEVDFDGMLDPVAVLGRLHDHEPSCTAFALPTREGRFLGASPELLVARRGERVRCHPLAGTVGLDGGGGGEGRNDEAVRRLAVSAKDHDEHRVMVEDLVAALAPFCETLDVPPTPSLVRLRTVAHLGSDIHGMLRRMDGDPPTALELLAVLQPTAAVSGAPRSDALRLISSIEGTPRGHWAGPVGWMDARGDGDWMIGIRSATLLGSVVRLCAGAGIVAGSDPSAELSETTVKLAGVLEAVVPGSGARLCHA